MWEIGLGDDGQALVASLSNIFWTNEKTMTHSLDFSGDLFARLTDDNLNKFMFVEIFNWRLSTSDLHVKAVFRLQIPYKVRVGRQVYLAFLILYIV